VALSPDEKTLYVADYLNHAIRAIDLGTKRVTTLAGNGKAGFANGKGDQAQFNQPYNVKIAANGRLYVPDQNNHAIRRIDQDGTVSTVAGNGQSGFANGRASDARFTIRPASAWPRTAPSTCRPQQPSHPRHQPGG
jgi:DNA-binding beta-propeller fold protein YncE